ncbi:hypothetical protein [Nitratireductor rhodophyticola]|uniref:Bbp19 family protein n=1 Tax=Nitratireductor rhodophyticola TaxID=2854036 RepID=UPI003BAA891E
MTVLVDQQKTVEQEELEKAFRAVFATNAGKRVLFRVFELAAMFQTPFSGENTNATNHTIGRQEVGRMLLSEMNGIDPRMYPQLLLDMEDIRETDRSAGSAAAEAEREDNDEAP